MEYINQEEATRTGFDPLRHIVLYTPRVLSTMRGCLEGLALMI
jgi:hypothetical protein